MTDEQEQYRELQSRLEEAARWCRPRHPGWGTLLERLPSQEPAGQSSAGKARQPSRSPNIRLRWGAAALAASLLVAAGLGSWLLFGPRGSAQAQVPPIEVQRRGVQVTVFSASDDREPTLYMPIKGNPGEQSPGMALVKDQRMVLYLRKGDNLVKFTDVAATIDPTSVRLVSDTDPSGTKVVEQNFEYDLASADALLKRSLAEKITCVGKDDGRLYEGYLLSYDDATIVLADGKPAEDPDSPRPKTQTISRGKLQAIRLDHKPADLYARPTLVWKLRTDKPGDHLTTLTYLCGDAVWRADYVALIRESRGQQETLDLGAWVTIDNRSGTTYENAGLKLIAGDVHRVRDLWAPRAEGFVTISDDLGLVGFLDPRVPKTPSPKEFVEKSFFEYKLYTLNQPSTIKDREIKQLSLFKAEGVRARRRYVCRSHPTNLYCTLDSERAEAQLLVKNEQKNRLGRPLPKGTIRVTALDQDGDVQLLARGEIDHTAKDEELEIDLGRAFDVVYDYRIIDTRGPVERPVLQTYQFRLRNHKPAEVQVRVIGRLMADKDWRILHATDDCVRHDSQTVHLDVRVKADSEKVVTYTIEYRR